jgi:hypothetical protein
MTELKERIMGEVACSKRGEAKAVVAKVRAAGFEARISPWRNSYAEYPNDRMVLVWRDMNAVEDADKKRVVKEFWNAVNAAIGGRVGVDNVVDNVGFVPLDFIPEMANVIDFADWRTRRAASGSDHEGGNAA